MKCSKCKKKVTICEDCLSQFKFGDIILCHKEDIRNFCHFCDLACHENYHISKMLEAKVIE